MNGAEIICPNCSYKYSIKDMRCPACKRIQSRILPIYVVVDVSKSVSRKVLDDVRDALNNWMDKLRAEPVLWGNKICVSVIAVGDYVQEIVPLAIGQYVQVPAFTISGTAELHSRTIPLRSIVTRDLGAEPDDRKRLWKLGVHRPMALAIANINCTDDWYYMRDWNMNGTRPQWSFDMDFWMQILVSPHGILPWLFAEEFHQHLDIKLDIEADAVPEWLDEGWYMDEDAP